MAQKKELELIEEIRNKLNESINYINNHIKEINNNIGIILKESIFKYLFYYDCGIQKINKLEFEDYNNIIINSLKKSIEISNNKSFSAALNLGVIYRELEMYNEAIEYYNKAIEIDSNNPISFINKAELIRKNKDNIENSEQLFKECIDKALLLGKELPPENFEKNISPEYKPEYKFYHGIESAFFDLETTPELNKVFKV